MDNRTKDKLIELVKNNNLSILILFGSRAKGNFTKNSDWDFAFIKNQKITTEEEIDLYNSFMKILRTEKIDLINLYKNQNPLLQYEIFNSGKVIFQKDKLYFKRLKMKNYIDYMDSKRFTEIKKELLKKELLNLST